MGVFEEIGRGIVEPFHDIVGQASQNEVPIDPMADVAQMVMPTRASIAVEGAQLAYDAVIVTV
jgi:hypothetical protein